MPWILETEPVHLGGGTVARVMRDGDKLQVELWDKPTGDWKPGATSPENLRAIDMAPPVTDELRARLGMPPGDDAGGRPPLELDDDDGWADWLHRRHRDSEPDTPA